MLKHGLRALALGVVASVAYGGMGSVVPTDYARTMRLTESAHGCFQAISFFLLVLFLSALAVRWLWSRVRKDVPVLPRLTFGKAAAIVAMWGLLFLVVLTMIATTREMMTPGAWRKVGILYEVVPSSPPPRRADRTEERKTRIEELAAGLRGYARQHEGRLPAPTDGSIAAPLWEVPGGAGLRYVYLPLLAGGKSPRIVAYEPEIFGDRRFVLYSDGRVAMLNTADIQQQLQK